MPTRSSSVPSRVSRECEALRRRLTQWRATRPHLRAAIPEPLWTEGGASRHIVCRVRRRINMWRCRDVPVRHGDFGVQHTRVGWHFLHGRRHHGP